MEQRGMLFWTSIGTIVITTTIILTAFYRKTRRLRTLIDPNKKYPLKLIEKINISHNTRLFRFALPSQNHILGLPPGQHIYLSANINAQLVVRTYSPVSSMDALGHMDLIIKVYFKDVHPNYPAGGKMSQYLNNLSLGETVDIRGPTGSLIYNGRGEFAIRRDKKSPPNIIQVKQINMIAGGSGITPILQIVKAVFNDPSDNSVLSLVFANQTEDDILCRPDLEKLQTDYPTRFKLHYTLSRPPKDGWQYSTGYINDSMLKENFYPPSNETIVLMCGPTPMVQSACLPALDKLNYDVKLRYVY